jgi:alkylhydroperoxidase/carboxymuconolactone decarboxylase family protein YurZ
MPAYQNATLERVLTRRFVPVKIDPAVLQDDCFYILELADATGKKTDFVPVHPGCRLQTTSGKPLVRIVSQKGAGSTIDLPPTDLEQGVVGTFMRSLKEEKQVTFAAHNKPKEEKDLDITVEDDSHDIVKTLTPFMTAANLKAVGSSAVFHLFHAILKRISSPPIIICGDKNLAACSDIHSLPVEVCVLALLYPLLAELPQEEIREALASSVSMEGEEQTAAVRATFHGLVGLKGLAELPQEEIRQALASSVSLAGKEQTAAVQATFRGLVALKGG